MNQKGFINIAIIIGIVILAGIAGYFVLNQQTQHSPVPTVLPLPQSTSIRDDEQKTQGFKPLTAAEIQQAMTVLKSDDRVRTSLATSRRLRTISIERHEEDKPALTSARRANVVLYNYDRNEIISAVVALGPRPRVDHLTVIRDQEPMSAQGVEEAKKLALADSNVQAQLRTAGLAGRENELIITNRRFESAVPDDPCSIHLCIQLNFNTSDANLGIHAVVDLTTMEVKTKRR